MNILAISNLFPPGYIGGYELGAFDICQHLSKEHDVRVLTSDYLGECDLYSGSISIERSLEFRLLTHEMLSGSSNYIDSNYINWRNVRKICSSIVRHKPNLVLLFNTAGLGPLGINQFVVHSTVPAVNYFMDNVFSGAELGSPTLEAYVKIFGPVTCANGIVSMSRNLMSQINPCAHAEESSILYAPGWVPYVECVRNISNSPNVIRKFVFSSRIAPHKGTDLLILAAAKLREAKIENFQVDVYGEGNVSAFLEMVKAKNLEKHINYRGSLDKFKMISKFSEYDALLFPTWEREPFGFVAVEAAAMGCVPIITDGAGASEWLIDGVDCIKITRSASDVAKSMKKIIDMNDDELRSLRNNCRNHAGYMFSEDRWMRSIENFCNSIALNSKPYQPNKLRGQMSSFLFLNRLFRDSIISL